MRTPEEILAKHHCTQTEFERKAIIEAMTDYAQQEAETTSIDFKLWCDSEENIECHRAGRTLSPKELYTLFKTEKKDGK
jgi:ribonuclease HI